MTNEERLDYFLNEVVRDTVKEFLEAPEASLRLGVLAAIAVNQLVDFIHKGRPDLTRSMRMDDFRGWLAKHHCPDLPLLRDVAEATKHPDLRRRDPPPQLPGIEAVRSHPPLHLRDGTRLSLRDGSPLELRQLDACVGEKRLTDIVATCFDALERLIATPAARSMIDG